MIGNPPRVLALNAGSSSLKWSLYAGREHVSGGAVDRIGLDGADHGAALARILGGLGTHELSRVEAVGHRVVHGGPLHDRARRVTPQLLRDLKPLAALDPDHLPSELSIIDEMSRRLPDLAQVSCFDTAFFSDLPRVARLLPIPRRYVDEGVRRYGFHGLSYTFLMDELGRTDPAAARGRVVLAHLGSGASMAAVLGGRCIETTMGFTPNSGLMMGSRSGDLEPGVILHLLRSGHAVDDLVSHRSGLLGVSGTSSDMRDLLAVEADDPHAAEAVDLFCYQAVKAVGALAATLGGLDTLVFSGGIGENAAAVRRRIAERLGHLGVEIDPARNQAGLAVISTDESRTIVRILHTDEESVIARQTIAVLTDGDPT